MERARHRLQRVLRIGELVRLRDSGAARRGEQEPVVGPDEEPPGFVAKRQRPAGAADAGIDDREVHPDRHVRDRVRKHERALEHRLWRDAVRDVDDLRFRSDRLHDSVARANEIVLEAEVAQERDEHARSVTRAGPKRTSAPARLRWCTAAKPFGTRLATDA